MQRFSCLTTCVSLSLLAGCARQPIGAEGATPVVAMPRTPVPLSQLYQLEVSGVPPNDTAVTFSATAARRIILRHGAPDNNVFVELDFPAGSFGKEDPAESVTVAVHPRPGVYGIDLACSRPIGPHSRIRFKYPVHFSAPVSAIERYGSPTAFERQLTIAFRPDSGNLTPLSSTRPASDNLETELVGSVGTYLVVAPR